MKEQAFQMIQRYDTIIIHRHTFPDGDAIGSQVGLRDVIKSNYPDKAVYIVGDGAGRFGFIDGSTPDEIADETYQGALAIVLDTSCTTLISDDRYSLADKTLRIDHHLMVEKIADVEIVDSTCESCCGLVTSLVREWRLDVPRSAATALYAGMVTDSGRFRYSSTTPVTFDNAGFLLSKGIDTGWIFGNLYADSYDNLKRKAEFLLKIRFTEHRVAYIYTTYDEILSYGANPNAISRGMVNTMADIIGSNIWVNFTENGNEVLVEIRSKSHNINQIAVKYGGGGHTMASGAGVADKETAMKLLADLDSLAQEEIL